MAWQTAPGMIVIIGGFSLVGAMFAGVDGLANWIYKKVSLCVQKKEGGRRYGSDVFWKKGLRHELCLVFNARVWVPSLQ